MNRILVRWAQICSTHCAVRFAGWTRAWSSAWTRWSRSWTTRSCPASIITPGDWRQPMSGGKDWKHFISYNMGLSKNGHFHITYIYDWLKGTAIGYGQILKKRMEPFWSHLSFAKGYFVHPPVSSNMAGWKPWTIEMDDFSSYKPTFSSGIFHCHVWLPEGFSSFFENQPTIWNPLGLLCTVYNGMMLDVFRWLPASSRH